MGAPVGEPLSSCDPADATYSYLDCSSDGLSRLWGPYCVACMAEKYRSGEFCMSTVIFLHTDKYGELSHLNHMISLNGSLRPFLDHSTGKLYNKNQCISTECHVNGANNGLPDIVNNAPPVGKSTITMDKLGRVGINSAEASYFNSPLTVRKHMSAAEILRHGVLDYIPSASHVMAHGLQATNYGVPPPRYPQDSDRLIPPLSTLQDNIAQRSKRIKMPKKHTSDRPIAARYYPRDTSGAQVIYPSVAKQLPLPANSTT